MTATLRNLTKQAAMALFAVSLLGTEVARAEGLDAALHRAIADVRVSTESAEGINAWATTQYQVEFRHSEETNNEWRVSVVRTDDYTYAKGTYDYLVGLNKYDVRLYKRTRR